MRKPVVLFIGPERFPPHVGLKNIRVILPSLLDPLSGCEFHLLHRMKSLPDYTSELTEKYGVIFHSVKDRRLIPWLRKTINLVNTYNIDVLTNVFFGFRLGFIAAVAAKITHRQSVVRFAANEIYVRKCAGAYQGVRGKFRMMYEKKMEKIAIKFANQVIAMSPWEEKRLKKISIKTGKVKWCMRGVDISHFTPFPQKKSNGARKFLYVGRKVHEKGYGLIEDVARRIEKRYEDIQFYFAGTFDPGVEGNRHYLGYFPAEKIVELYVQMDALILPSQSEGFSNAIVEAMATGLPCIISRAFHDQYFLHKENALLIELTKDDLEKNILMLHHQKELHSRLCQNVRKLAVKEFDSKQWGKKYRDIILKNIPNKQSAGTGRPN